MSAIVEKCRKIRCKTVLAVLAVLAIGSFSGGCREERSVHPEAGTLPDRSGMERTIYIQATEMDARRSTEQDPFPQETIDAWPDYFGPGDDPFDRAGKGGYYLFMTAEDEWRIGSYMFVPQEAIAYRGEHITLEVFGVRGSHHINVLRGPDGNVVKDPGGEDIRFTVHRGELKSAEFIAEQPGLYRLICEPHPPTMVMNIHVLP